MKNKNEDESRLQKVMTYGSSFCGATVAAALQSFRGGMSFEFSGYTSVAAAVGFIAFVTFWKLLFSESKSKARKTLLAVITTILIASGFAGVFYPLKFVASTEFPNLMKGVVTAAFALAGGASLLLMCKRFFDADEKTSISVSEKP